MSKINTHRQLDIWKKSIELVKDVYKVTSNFPQQELYGLTNQMRRSAVSIPSNVAEGFRRQHNNEFRQFLHIALGSCAELETQVTIAKELNYIKEQIESMLLEKSDHICRMTRNLIKKL
ncbi:MAG: four helix bundle protein [Sedimentisphaerales bacterium]|jgi:four helix bundle protein